MSDDRRVIVVLGAGGALGSSIVARLAAQPDADLVVSDVSERSVAATVAASGREAAGSNPGKSSGAAIESVVADVRDLDQVDAVVDRALDRFGRLDALISNAGVLNRNGRIHNLTDDDWRRVIDVNLMGSVNAVRSAVRVMRPQGSGSIILTASVAGITAWSHSGPYCVSKAGVIQLAKVAAVEYAREGIRVNCVCPGSFRSAIHDDLPDEAVAAIGSRHPLGMGAADDIAGAYAYLAGPESRWTTGTALVVDGGYSAP